MRFTEGVEHDQDAVLLDVPDEQTPAVVRALVEDGCDVHEAVVHERTLEEVFFAMTRGQDDESGLLEPGTEVVR